jgi:NADH-quinone oxidoreductase subunit A
MIGISFVLGQRHNERATGSPYESGIVSTGSARVRFLSSFFPIAIFFVIFDMESIFIFAWASTAQITGWQGYCEICVFIGVLGATLAYLWRERALD